MSTTFVFPNNVLSLHDAEFYQLIKQTCGDFVVDALQIQEISSIDSLLRTENIFSFFNFESQHLLLVKEKIGIYLNDGSFIIKPGILIKVETLVNALRSLNEAHTPITASSDIILSNTMLRNFPFFQKIINFIQQSDDPHNRELALLYKFIENTFSNLTQPKSRYRYQDHMKSFALTIFLLGGRNLYSFIHLNFPGSLPNITTLQKTIAESSQGIVEGNFRYTFATQHLISKRSEYVFCSEDCTAVIPKVVYDSRSNTFIGFSLPLFNGFPQVECYSTSSFQQLEDWFLTKTQSKLLNIHIIQPVSSQANDASPYLLAVYGTDGRYTSNDIISRWKTIFDKFREKGIRILGYSTDCDPKYLRAMRIIIGFFTSSVNTSTRFGDHAFVITLDPKWVWFYLRPKQHFLCLQDSVHLTTKLRNRLLSSTATMLLGNESINIKFLLQLIRDVSKIDHGLTKSDIVPKDRQNYLSCMKISSDCVLELLEKMKSTRAMCIYLKVSRK